MVLYLSGAAIAQTPTSFKQAVDAQYSKDYVKAAQLYRQGANRGHAASQHELGMMYLLGQGVPQDFVEAYKWFNLAAAYEPQAERF